MATNFVKGNLNFSLRTVTAGQKGSSVSVDPQLIAASTLGKFTITPQVSIAMNLQPGEFIGFADNFSELQAAVAAKQEDVVAVFEENGLDINNSDDVEVFYKEMRVIAIFKGYPLFNADGTPMMANVRTSKEEKEKYLADNFDAILEANREAIVAALAANGNENPTEDDIKSCITIDNVGSKQEPAYYGSRTATVTNQTGVGLTLNFSDTNIWNSMKRNIDPALRNRTKSTYDVDIKNPVTLSVNDGVKDLEVVAYPLNFVKTDEVADRKSASAE